MNTRRLEQLVIIILAVLDLCLLAIVAADRLQTVQDGNALQRQVAELLEENGVRADQLRLPETPPQLRLLRDAAGERKQMKTLLGAERGSDQGGGIRFYRGERGQALLRGTGELELLFSGLTYDDGRDPVETAERLFARAGLPLTVSERVSGDPDVLLRCCLWDGVPIINAVLRLERSGETLSLASGTIPFQKETERSTEGVMDAATAIARFLELMRRDGLVCSRLNELSAAYLISVPVAGESALTPLWRIETDTGVFYLNAVTGRMESAA